jgi:hypothetical protein
MRYWAIEIAPEEIHVSAGGAADLAGYGGDSFTILDWTARAGRLTDFEGERIEQNSELEAFAFAEQILRLDLSEGDFKLDVEDG